MGYMESLYPEFALFVSNISCAWTNIAFSPLPEVSTRVVTLSRQPEIDTAFYDVILACNLFTAILKSAFSVEHKVHIAHHIVVLCL